MGNPIAYGFLAPPTLFITLCLVGAVIASFWRRSGIALVLLSSLYLFVSALPAVSSLLLAHVEAQSSGDPDLSKAQVIVVLGGDVRLGNGAGVPDALGPLSLERVFWAAQAYRRLHLPVLVSGGRVGGAQASEAALMKTALETEFGVPVQWAEDASRTTWENAVFSARLLRRNNIGAVLLISEPWHLPRAAWSFQEAGLTALDWPAPRTQPRHDRIEDFLPSMGALRDSFYAMHETLGSIYYRLRH
jgi:uncharacterized SAM-binding protein YcdF (DUF218 family)